MTADLAAIRARAREATAYAGYHGRPGAADDRLRELEAYYAGDVAALLGLLDLAAATLWGRGWHAAGCAALDHPTITRTRQGGYADHAAYLVDTRDACTCGLAAALDRLGDAPAPAVLPAALRPGDVLEVDRVWRDPDRQSLRVVSEDWPWADDGKTPFRCTVARTPVASHDAPAALAIVFRASNGGRGVLTLARGRPIDEQGVRLVSRPAPTTP